MSRMDFRMNLKMICAAIFVFTSLYTTDAARHVAFSDTPAPVTKQGLPAEMIITAEQLRQKQLSNQRFILIDARNRVSYEQGHIKNAVLPYNREYYKQEKLFKQSLISELPDANAALKENINKYTKGTPIVAYCGGGSCQASAVLALEIKRLGFTDVKVMEDGFPVWEEKGYPVARNTKI